MSECAVAAKRMRCGGSVGEATGPAVAPDAPGAGVVPATGEAEAAAEAAGETPGEAAPAADTGIGVGGGGAV